MRATIFVVSLLALAGALLSRHWESTVAGFHQATEADRQATAKAAQDMEEQPRVKQLTASQKIWTWQNGVTRVAHRGRFRSPEDEEYASVGDTVQRWLEGLRRG
jgi:hypothetical protein